MRIEKDEDGQEMVVTWALNPRGTELLAWGESGHIFNWPENPTEVMKLPTADPNSIEDIEIEKHIYKCLGSHPNIVPCLRIAETGPVSVCAEHIVLKRAEQGTIRQYFVNGGTATVDERIKWCRDIAYVHDHGIRHGDIGGRNVLLDSSKTVLLCDFAGSGVDGKPPRVRAEEGFKRPVLNENWNGTIRSELHALGSTIYEISLPKCHITNFKTGWSIGFESVIIQALQTIMSRAGWSSFGSKRVSIQTSLRSSLEILLPNAGRANTILLQK